jgi:photosystem II stability/assembly factor-like uncharacterized protein
MITLSCSLWQVALLARADVDRWTTSGPPGSEAVSTIMLAPTAPTIVYAASESKVLRSANGGARWTGTSTNLRGTPIRALAVDPTNEGIVYVGTENGVFKSVDGGASWMALNEGLPAPAASGIEGPDSVGALAIDPTNPATVYAGATGVFKSTDGGAHWTASNTGLTRCFVDDITLPCSVTTLAIDGTAPATLYAGATIGVFKSVDGGAHWVFLNTGADMPVTALMIAPTTPATIYVGIWNHGVLESTDGGATWTRTNASLSETDIFTLAVHPTTPTTVYSGTRAGVFQSADGGTTWTAINTGLTDLSIATLAIDSTQPTSLYAGTPRGVFKSTNGGASWALLPTGLSQAKVSALAIDPLHPSVVYASDAAGDIFKSVDGGERWSPLHTKFINASIMTLAIDPQNPAVTYAGTVRSLHRTIGGGIFKSTDGGASWTAINAGLPDALIGVLAIDPKTPNVLYAGTDSHGVFKSSNGGESWATVNVSDLYTSVRALAIDPITPTTVYAGTRYCRVFKTIDGGASWTEMSNGLPEDPGGEDITLIRVLAIDPLHPETVYAGTSHGGVFKTWDGGKNWVVMNNGLPSTAIGSIVIDPHRPSILYAGTVGRIFMADTAQGVFMSTDGGAHWAALNMGLTSLSVSHLAIDPQAGRTLYAGTSSGVFTFQIPVQ